MKNNGRRLLAQRGVVHGEALRSVLSSGTLANNFRAGGPVEQQERIECLAI